MVCITGAKFTMRATLLHVNNDYTETVPDPTVGTWIERQDPITGEIVNQWQPGLHQDIVGTVEDETVIGDFDCVARGMSTADRFSSTERFGENYKNIDMVKLWVPASLRIKKSDRVTNIRDKAGNLLWIDDDGSAVVFNVNGVTPQLGPFNVHTETFALLERAEVF